MPTRKRFMAAPVKLERDGRDSSFQAGHTPAFTIEKARRFRIRLSTPTAKDIQSIVDDCDAIFCPRIGRHFLPFHSDSNFTFL